MGRRRVLIGVSGRGRYRSDIGLIRWALRSCGARTLWLLPGMTIPWSRLDGVVIAGGIHVHPQRYHQQPEIRAAYNPARDELEFTLLHGAHRRGLPVLGICRGAQAINIFQGGDLHQDITSMRRETRPQRLLLPLQQVLIKEGSRLSGILEHRRLGANRLHSQAIRRLGRGLDVAALDRDGFVQAIEGMEDQWLVGVQWHPEYLLYRPAHRRLFRELVRAAGIRARQEEKRTG